MVLFENNIITLNYDPSTDIMEMKYPDLQIHLLPEIKHSLGLLMETVRNYDIKKLLLDSSTTYVNVSPEITSEVTAYLAGGLVNTRLEKLARVQSYNTVVEAMAANNIRSISTTLPLQFILRNFSKREEALLWLKSDATI